MMCEPSELSEVAGLIARSLISNSSRVAFSFVSHLVLRPRAEPHGVPDVFVDQHVEDCCCVFGVGSLSWYRCIVESCNSEVVGNRIFYNMKLNENGQLLSHACRQRSIM